MFCWLMVVLRLGMLGVGVVVVVVVVVLPSFDAF